MTFIDTYDNKRYTMRALYNDYITFRAADPDNHAPDFITELFEILMASVNGRNDLDIIGMTPSEIGRYISLLRAMINNKTKGKIAK